MKLLSLVIALNILLTTACQAVVTPSAVPSQPPTAGLSSPTDTAIMPTITAAASASPDRPAVTPTTPPQNSASLQGSTPEATPTQRTHPVGDDWMELPIIPTVSETAIQIYQRGLENGRNPHAFSKIGDCQSIPTYFLALFDKPGFYQLGAHSHLQETIDWYSGSFQRESLAVKGGLNAAAILSPLRADPQACQAGESPVDCELRVHNPSLVIISLEEWWADDPTKYERYMRQIVEYVISLGILPILATKADNLEGNHLINQTIALLAWEYEVPLWNFWRAVQPLPHHGLVEKNSEGQPDLFHLTHGDNYYNYTDLNLLQSGWAMRNLTALQTLDAVWRALVLPAQTSSH